MLLLHWYRQYCHWNTACWKHCSAWCILIEISVTVTRAPMRNWWQRERGTFASNSSYAVMSFSTSVGVIRKSNIFCQKGVHPICSFFYVSTCKRMIEKSHDFVMCVALDVGVDRALWPVASVHLIDGYNSFNFWLYHPKTYRNHSNTLHFILNLPEAPWPQVHILSPFR